MSVMTLNPKHLDSMYRKMRYYEYHGTFDINYCAVLFKMKEEQMQSLVYIWAKLNEDSYLARYRENLKSLSLASMINFKSDFKDIDTWQFLKHLKFLHYNIEIETIAAIRELTQVEKEAYSKLEAIIADIQDTIIYGLPQYQAAKWGNQTVV